MKKAILKLLGGLILLASSDLCQATANDWSDTDIWIYTVESGDNLWALTEKYLLNMSYVQRVQKLNHIADPYHVPPGTKLRIPAPWIITSPTLAVVKNLQGQAELIAANTKMTSLLHIDSTVQQGDAVRTKADSALVLKFIDGSSLSLMADSYLALDHLGQYNNTGMTDTRLKLQQGRLETQVAPRKGTATRFQITTPASVTSVRGTDYRVNAEAVTSRTEVLHGGVAVSNNGQAKIIPKGFGTITALNQPPLPPIPLLPAPDISHVSKRFTRVPLQFDLPELPPRQGYRVQIAKTAAFSDVVFDRKYSSASVSSAELPDGDYQLRVRGIDEKGLEGHHAELHFVLSSQPEAPFLLEVKPYTGDPDEKPVFAWLGQQSIHNYHIQIAADKDFKNVLIDRAEQTDVNFTPEQALQTGLYFWRVASIDAQGNEGPFSDAQPLKRLFDPELAHEIDDESITIRIPAGLPGQAYQFQLARDEKFTDLLIDQHTSDPQLKLAPQPEGTYYLRVRTINADGSTGVFGTTRLLIIS